MERRPRRLERWLAGTLLRALGAPPVSLVLWDGTAVSVSPRTPVGRVRIHDAATLYRLAVSPELAFGEAYSEGRLEVDGDLARLLIALFRTWHAGPGLRAASWLARTVAQRPNTLRRSREHIHHHYDLGNDFYAGWLDEEMVYTCAYFPTPESSLEEAQRAKLEHVCRKLGLRAGERVAEAGCGWGALALHMARHHGVRVRAFNISEEQVAHARARAEREGLADRVEFVADDYRNISGRYDVFVSVGMLEHVGREHHRHLGRTIDRCLTPDGRGLVHSIGRNRPQRMNAWMARHIFPGAYIPSLQEITGLLGRVDMSVLDVENLRLHYAKTLTHWIDRFDKVSERATQELGPSFVRTWRLYLASSLAAFETGSMQLFQVTFARSGTNRIPWTRAHLYGRGPADPAWNPATS